MKISSPAFGHMEEIPAKYTCDGADVSPPLVWSDVPPASASLALIVDDPDAPDPANPKTIWTHWILYDLPPAGSGLPEGAGSVAPPPGTRAGVNDWGRPHYGGPCPPIGRHRYRFRLYALDSTLGDVGQPTRGELLAAIDGHLIEMAELIGTYQRR